MSIESIEPQTTARVAPLVVPLDAAPEPVEAFCRLARLPHCVFFDSAQRHEKLGRFSFVAADPYDFLEVPAADVEGEGAAALLQLRRQLSASAVETIPELPPFQGGAAGLLGYDLSRAIESVPRCRFDEFQVPALAVGLYDVVLAYDHRQQRAWLISHGLPEAAPDRRRERAAARAAKFRALLEPGFVREEAESVAAASLSSSSSRAVAAAELCPQFATMAGESVTSNFTRDGYLRAVERIIEYIYAGDIFQANFAQRLLAPASDSSLDLYLRLRERNAAPFAGYFDLGEFQIVSASPERFLQLRDGEVEARPIKGTRRRLALPEADFYAGDDLQQSEKDRAENVMIVDLLRNDLARVCAPDSVRVTQLCHLESYAYVQHLVSAIVGRLEGSCDAIDLLRASFPGGSITGAPKVRAMEIIAELEPTARGPYCGALGYVGFDGSMDTSILIRTIVAGRGWWQAGVGGGIVAQSDPAAEYEETWHKAEGLLRALS